MCFNFNRVKNLHKSLKSIVFFFLIITSSYTYAQIPSEFKTEQDSTLTKMEKYETSVYIASKSILSKPIVEKSAEFISDSKIVKSWLEGKNGFGIPLGGRFYHTLSNTNHQQYLYSVAIANYMLDQKLNHNRVLNCSITDNQIYREQVDVKEVRYQAAILFLEYVKNSKNNIKIRNVTKKFLKSYKKGEFETDFFKYYGGNENSTSNRVSSLK